jgi:SPP1 gp7 family putative phage head morphogenesis protein
LGEGIPDLRKRVNELFDGMEKYRAERIARSEVIRASNFAAQEAYRQSGVVNEVEWLATDDDRLCEFCAPLSGEHIALGDTFFDKGDSYRGSDGGMLDLNYEDIEHPPLHVNCRCALIPIIK